MPQWNRDSTRLTQRYPNERWVAGCDREHAEALRRADHHVVWIAGRRALLLTYIWDAVPRTDWPEQLTLEVSFTYAQRHPVAPEAVQRIVDSLAFEAASRNAPDY